MSRILIIRFSAIGDIAMTIPVITSFAEKYNQHEIYVLSRKKLESIFKNMPSNVKFVAAEFEARHKGLWGLNRLFNELKVYDFDYIADFHDVLRSKFLLLRFAFLGLKTVKIDKGRNEKRLLVRKNNKHNKQLKTSFERYADVLKKLGFDFECNFRSIFDYSSLDKSEIKSKIENVVCKGKTIEQFKSESVCIQDRRDVSSPKWIGIAPFAKHIGKVYPLDKMEKVVSVLSRKYRIFLLGGGPKEESVFNTWTDKYPNIISLAGRFDMNTELFFMTYLDVMVSMDSANMHLASLVNCPVVSVWGATHPYCGFMGWRQKESNAVQLDMKCRPCSVFGDKPCLTDDYACLNGIEPEMVLAKLDNLLG